MERATVGNGQETESKKRKGAMATRKIEWGKECHQKAQGKSS